MDPTNDSGARNAQRSSELVEPVFASHDRLLGSEDLAADIDGALGLVGEASGVDRVYVFEVTALPDGTHSASQRFEWVREGIAPQLENPDLQDVPLEEMGYGRWMRLLHDYQPVFGLIREFPPEEQPLLSAQDILSLLVIPIFTEGRLWGFAGFDDCRHNKVWTRSDIDLLLSLSIAIGARLASAEGDTEGVAEGALSYVSVVRNLANLRELAGSRQPLSDLLNQSRARIRALVGIHRFLLVSQTKSYVDAAELLDFWQGELRTTLDECGSRDLRLRAMSESFGFPRGLILQTMLIVHELVLAYTCDNPDVYREGGLSLGMHHENGTAVLRLRLEGHTDEDGVHSVPDPLGLVLVRRITQELDGYLEVPAAEAAARLVVPLRHAAIGN